jgi:type II secretory pathway component GspD/PulD (secretin)
MNKRGFMDRTPHPILVSVMLFVPVIFPVAAAQEGPRSSVRRESSPREPRVTRKTTDQTLPMTFKDGRLSVNSQGRTLEDLASEISDKAGVPVILDSAVAKQSVSLNFQDLALDEGLRQIFKNNDAFFFYGADKDEPSALKVVWVYPKGKARGMAPIPRERWASTKDLEQMLTDPDPDVRARAFEAIVERRPDEAPALVSRALNDKDDQVRTRALYGATKAGVELPVDSLRDLALNDASADVRFLALQLLANNADVKSVAEIAVSDPSEPVRLEAKEILQRLSDDQSPEPSKPPQGQEDILNQ